MPKSSNRKRKGSVSLVNDRVWNMRICPKSYVLSVSNDDFTFKKDFVNVTATDQMVATISKSCTPDKLMLNHTNLVLQECVD